MRIQDRAKAECLRRLRAPELATIDGLDDRAAAAALDRVGDGQGRDRAHAVAERRQHAVDEISFDEGAGAVVDRHRGGIELHQTLEAETHGILPLGAADRRRQQIETRGGGIVERAIVGVDHRAHRRDRGMRAERAKGVAEQRLAGERQILLGKRPADAAAAPRRHHQRNARIHGRTLMHGRIDCQDAGSTYSRGHGFELGLWRAGFGGAASGGGVAAARPG